MILCAIRPRKSIAEILRIIIKLLTTCRHQLYQGPVQPYMAFPTGNLACAPDIRCPHVHRPCQNTLSSHWTDWTQAIVESFQCLLGKLSEQIIKGKMYHSWAQRTAHFPPNWIGKIISQLKSYKSHQISSYQRQLSSGPLFSSSF